MKKLLIAILAIFLIGCSAENTDNTETIAEEETKAVDRVQVISLLGKELISPEPSQKVLDNLAAAKEKFDEEPTDMENIIWYGRRVAYTGDFKRAIEIYSEGLLTHPDSSRLYRHRGHRYISIRAFDSAISDYEIAATLIEGEEDTIEQDGAPGPTGIPVSSRHTNIWYHLGLSYYLVHDWENSLRAYQTGHDLGLNDDNIVSAAHWIYMIHNRMGNPEKAQAAIAHITADMDVIENFSYHNLVLFYKGEIPPGQMLDVDPNDPSGTAIAYGVANWYLYNKQPEKAYELMQRFMDTKSWASFGFIAAEVELKLR